MLNDSSRDIDALNERFASSDEVRFVEGLGGLPVLRVRNSDADADIHPYAAHVTHYKPRGASPVLWLSPDARFERGKAIRGGIPVCFPWFGPHATDASLPSHGFARTADWTVASVESLEAGATSVVLSLASSDATRSLWPHAFAAELRVTVAAALTVALHVTNVDDTPLSYEDALHTYFSVGDIAQTEVRGLAGVKYIDRVAGGATGAHTEPAITFDGEYDRTFLDTTASCELVDRSMSRTIVVAKTGSRSTVVWNPHVAKSAITADLPDDGWKTMLCIETANCNGLGVTLAPGEEHDTTAVISVA
jgi:glucose-6-phosphate 1-epimerase